jgi:hypothetical protein
LKGYSFKELHREFLSEKVIFEQRPEFSCMEDGFLDRGHSKGKESGACSAQCVRAFSMRWTAAVE